MVLNGNSEIDISPKLNQVPKRTAKQYVLQSGTTPIKITDKSNLLRITQPSATIAGADILATADPKFSEIFTDEWNINTGDKLSDRVQMDTKLSMPVGADKGVINLENQAVSYNGTSWKPVSIQSLPINHKLKDENGAIQNWVYNASGRLVVLENNIQWSDFQKSIFLEVYGVADWQHAAHLVYAPEQSLVNEVNNDNAVQELFLMTQITLTGLSIVPDYGIGNITLWDGRIKTMGWTTRNAFAAQFP
jgi:hypothetical protein